MPKRLSMLAALFVFLAYVCEGEKPDSEIRRIVVIHFDTTRVDDWGCYGSYVKTPHVDALAARGMRYTNAVTCAPFTSPSVATFLTGVYPLRHGVRRTGNRLNHELTTLPEVLRSNGFVTAGFVSNPLLTRRQRNVGLRLNDELPTRPEVVLAKDFVTAGMASNPFFTGLRLSVGHRLNDALPTLAEVLSVKGSVTAGLVSSPSLTLQRSGAGGQRPRRARTLGYEQGFDVWCSTLDRLREDRLTGKVVKADSEWLTLQALDFVRTHRDDRFFLWMIHFDPHTPYDPPSPYDKMYLKEPALLAKSVALTDKKQMKYGPYKTSHQFVGRHQGEVTHVDAWLGKLIAELEGLRGKTLYVVLADHGESFGDDNLWFDHGQNLRYPCINVPMVLCCEGVVPKGVSHALVDNTDLYPTILDLAHVGRGDLDLAGRSLEPTFANEAPWPSRMTPMATHWGRKRQVYDFSGVRSKFFSLQCEYDVGMKEPFRILFYDHRDDPNETTNLAESRPEAVQAHLNFLTAKYAEMSAKPTPDGKVDDEEMQERLKAMGYLE